MANKQLPGFGLELPELTFEGVSHLLMLNSALLKIQAWHVHYSVKFVCKIELFLSSF
jgi:hypothetical protein